MKKYSRHIAIETLKLLLARSGNQCAFPECSHPLFNNNNIFVAQLCHIEAVSPFGQRYNPNKSSDEINEYNNLIFLCYRHHKETDNIDLYPVQWLKEIKATHEAKFKEETYNYSTTILDALIKETNSYWEQIEKLHAEHIYPEFAVPIDTKNDILSLINEVDRNLGSLVEVNATLMSECKTTHFESICLAFPNLLTRINVALDQIEIKYIEELLLKNPDAEDLKIKLKYLRERFAKTAQTSGLSD